MANKIIVLRKGVFFIFFSLLLAFLHNYYRCTLIWDGQHNHNKRVGIGLDELQSDWGGGVLIC